MSGITMTPELEDCIVSLHEIGVLKFGEFILKSGMKSPVYFDLRIIISYPKLMKTVAEFLWSVVPEENKNSYEHVCGVAYTGIPLATLISEQNNISMILKRKEVKAYGTGKLVEGKFSPDDKVLIIEDVLVSGSSVYETIETLVDLDLKAENAVVFLDREQGGKASLDKLGVKIRSVVTITEVMTVLQKHGKCTETAVKSVQKFIEYNSKTFIKTKESKKAVRSNNRILMSYRERSEIARHLLNKKLLQIMDSRKTNLCVAVGVNTSSSELLKIAKEVGPYICILKTHVALIKDFTEEIEQNLKEIADKHDFLLFEDAKYVDIGATVEKQYKHSGYWADIVTVAPVLAGSGMLKAIHKVNEERLTAGNKGVIIVAQMSSAPELKTVKYFNECVGMSIENPGTVMGFVSQTSVSDDPALIQFTPGVSRTNIRDGSDQNYCTPSIAVRDKCADVVIVGRAITQSSDVAEAAKVHNEESFNAYLVRTGQSNK